MKHASWTVIAIVLVLGAWTAVHLRKAVHAAPATPAALARADTTPRAPTTQTSTAHEQGSNTSPAGPPKDDLKDRLKNAKDYFALAKSILAQAKDGDAEAQYTLWQIHTVCYDALSALVRDQDGRALSWDEAMQKAARLNAPMEQVKAYYDLCHRFFSEDVSGFGDAMEWLQHATDAKYPRAEARTAQLRLAQDRQISLQKAGAIATGPGLLPPIGGDINPIDLLRSAVTSLDPDTLRDVADVVPSLDPKASAQERQIVRAAWLYLACQRGADCSLYGEPSMSYCAATDQNCTGIPQKLLEWTHYDWEAVQQRANQINAALNAKQWDKLGLGGS